MQEDLVKLCPQCGSEYQLWVERCLDCDVPLVHGREGQGEAIASQGKEETSHDMTTYPQNCVHLRNAAVGWIRRLLSKPCVARASPCVRKQRSG